jgi:maleamate amidohydrolase
MVEAANRMIRAADSLGLEIVYIGNEFSAWDIPANWFRRNASIAGRPGARLDDRLVVINDRYFSKRQGDAFSNPRLGAFLQSRDVRHVILAGVYANACVRCTARGALKRGYRVTVLRDAVAAASDAKREAALRKMQRQGVEVADSAAVLGSAPS